MLSFVPTPIGNLEDISYRSIKLLQEAEVLFCEDTRVTKKLLLLLQERLEIQFENDKEFISLHSHNEHTKLATLDRKIFHKSCVYVSDAGTPCISDPGVKLVQFCQANSLAYQVLPGANALLPSFAMSGFDAKEFIFFGFLHNKGKERQREIEKIVKFPFPVIVYESPKRVLSLIEQIAKLKSQKKIFAVKEISKLHEKSFIGSAQEVAVDLQKSNLQGEWVVVIDRSEKEAFSSEIVDAITDLEISLKDKSKMLFKLTGKPSKQWYQELLKNLK